MASRTGRRGRPLRRLGLGVLLAVGAALVAIQSSPQIRSVFYPVRTAAGDQLARSARPGLWARISGSAEKDRRIRELEAEIRDLARWRAAAISMAERLEGYEALLNALGEPPARGVTARVAAESDGPFAETLLANSGRAQGVEHGYVAVNEGGLVGRVVQLGERSARILLVTDFNSRVAVLGESTGLRAIMQGGRDGLGVLAERPELQDFRRGERILTSGEGGVFPRGIVVGRAVQRGGDWRVALAMDEGMAGFVRLIPPQQIPKPELEPPLDANAASGPAEEDPPRTAQLTETP